MRVSFCIVFFFSAGILCGFYSLVPSAMNNSALSLYALNLLLFLVGIGIGDDKEKQREDSSGSGIHYFRHVARIGALVLLAQGNYFKRFTRGCFRVRILQPFQHNNYQAGRRSARCTRSFIKYFQGNLDAPPDSPACKIFRTPGPHRVRRSDIDGYNSSRNNQIHRKGIRDNLDIQRYCSYTCSPFSDHLYTGIGIKRSYKPDTANMGRETWLLKS